MSTIQIDKLLQTVVNNKASDLHITTGQPPVIRSGGRMLKLETKTLEAEDTVSLMKSITPERNQQELQEKGGTDFGFAFGEQARFRVAVFKQRGHVGLVLRRIPNEFLSFEVLGLPPVIAYLITRPRGLFLVTGPTGSGTTTSLASMINHLNATEDRLIITREDPIEDYH
ncbi:MAG: ATPase, T2SS/T4P/T4SS family, partial [Planctomycetaceae bacterium]